MILYNNLKILHVTIFFQFSYFTKHTGVSIKAFLPKKARPPLQIPSDPNMIMS